MGEKWEKLWKGAPIGESNPFAQMPLSYGHKRGKISRNMRNHRDPNRCPFARICTVSHWCKNEENSKKIPKKNVAHSLGTEPRLFCMHTIEPYGYKNGNFFEKIGKYVANLLGSEPGPCAYMPLSYGRKRSTMFEKLEMSRTHRDPNLWATRNNKCHWTLDTKWENI